MPAFCSDLEIIFVEGGSSDGTWEEVQRVIAAYPKSDIKAFKQTGVGKGDAVRQGFSQARGDVLMILDADLTMPPEDLPKYYQALVSGKGEFINGSRLVYPMEKQAMRFLNMLANHIFAMLFTYLLNQRHTDTLCGTKALLRRDYEEITRNRAYFGDFDPFRRLRPDFWRQQTQPEDCRGAHPLCRAGIWGNADFPLPAWLASVADGGVCLSKAQSPLTACPIHPMRRLLQDGILWAYRICVREWFSALSLGPARLLRPL